MQSGNSEWLLLQIFSEYFFNNTWQVVVHSAQCNNKIENIYRYIHTSIMINKNGKQTDSVTQMKSATKILYKDIIWFRVNGF